MHRITILPPTIFIVVISLTITIIIKADRLLENAKNEPLLIKI